MVLLAIWAVRNYSAEAAYQKALTGISAERSANHLYESVESALSWAPEHSRALTLRGQSYYALAEKSGGDEKKVLLEMAVRELEPAFRANPADGSTLLTLALARAGLDDGEPALALFHEASTRRPGFAEHAWLLARNLPPGSEEQKQAYRIVTRLRPASTPTVVRELRAQLPRERLNEYVAEDPAAYRAWAWDATDSTEGISIALSGLQFAVLPQDQHDAGWLEYYIGLKTSEFDPPAALTWFRKALDHLQGEQAVHRNFGFALLKSGRAEEAKAQFHKSIQLNGDIANAAHLGLAQAEEALGSHRRAMAIYKRLESNPRLEAWVRQEAGAALRQMEKKL
jgi:tetratricopeptide (TPR) repeat protein